MNPMTSLARKLQARGHDVVFISVLDAEPALRAANLKFVPFCEQEYPTGSITQEWSSVAKMQGQELLRHSSRELMSGLTKATLDHLPEAIAEAGVEALVLDKVYFYIELVAMGLGIPYIHIWNVLHIDFSGFTPPSLVGFPHEITREAVERNIASLKTIGEILTPMVEIAKPYAEKFGLQIDWNDPTATTSKLAVISQTPKAFDFPDMQWPAGFHYTGPFHADGGRELVPFPWDKLTCEPLVYASMGTLVNGLEFVYRTILDAVRNVQGIQVVLSVGRNVDIDDLGPIPANVLVVSSAPQLELLKRASLCITHAGLNTTLEALAQGVPMIAIPIGYDQPGVATRIAYHRVGEVIELEDLTVARLARLIQLVHKNQSYRDKARHIQKAIAETRGLDMAAAVIERVLGITPKMDAEGAELLHA
jgi:MGT family glycosyltransferase